jgi:hypothetical protein
MKDYRPDYEDYSKDYEVKTIKTMKDYSPDYERL